MRLSVLITVFTFFVTRSDAQHYHYIYIQSEPQQAFYIKKDNIPLSSNTGGFLIIPRLSDSVYQLIAGFPQNLYPEYKFILKGINKDKGYTFKNFQEKGWGLVDNQTQQILMGEVILKKNEEKEIIPSPLTNDAFTVILASVINDPTLPGTELVSGAITAYPVSIPVVEKKTTNKTEAPPLIPETEKVKSSNGATTKKTTATENVPVAVKEDKNLNKDKEPAIVASVETGQAKTVPPAEKKKFITGSVKKISEHSEAGTLSIVFIDIDEKGRADTIFLSLEPEKKSAPEIQPKISETGKTELPPVVTSGPAPALKSTENKKTNLPEADTTLTAKRNGIRSDCKKMATDKDVQAVRRKIIAIREVDDMVATALRDFKTRCFTSEQVKSVSIVFVGDEGKYKLLDAAYPYVYDPSNYSTLVSLLNDDYYINRFRSLLK